MSNNPTFDHVAKRAKSATGKLVIVSLVVINVGLIVPSLIFSIQLNQYRPTLIIIGMSLAVWAVGYKIVKLIRDKLARWRKSKAKPTAADEFQSRLESDWTDIKW
ncbi:hypothetical protein [Arthrobacter castelli]|uniref:hypothetical protein n=1 Tax=Arthrobacter castelli TaxID=271431 RepID=UPI0004059202|nr:hypothetical protein [Arthrobacter castelli]